MAQTCLKFRGNGAIGLKLSHEVRSARLNSTELVEAALDALGGYVDEVVLKDADDGQDESQEIQSGMLGRGPQFLTRRSQYESVGDDCWRCRGFGGSGVQLAQGPKACDDLKTEIATKLDGKGVKGYSLDVVAKDAEVTDGKVVGTCEGGTKKIVYKKGGAAPKAEAPAKEPSKP